MSKERALMRNIDMCSQAVKLVSFDRSTLDLSSIRFNELYAVRTILYENLLDIDNEYLTDLLARYESIYDDYRKVSGQRLGMNYSNIATTCAIYAIDDFPPRLNDLFDEICKLVVERQQSLQKEKKNIESKF